MTRILLPLFLAACTVSPINQTEKQPEDNPYPDGYTLGDLVIDPGTLDFGNVDVDDSMTEELLFVNTGSAPISVVSASIEGDPAFTLESSYLSFDIEGGAEEVVNVRFSPTTETNYEGSLSVLISTESSPGEVVLMGSSGEATAEPESGEPSEEPVEGGLVLSTTTHDYGKISLNSTATFIIDVENTADEPINITGVSSSDAAFSLSPYSNVQEGEAISAGITRTMTINFMPTEEIVYSGKLTLNTDSDVTPTIDIDLEGEGEYQCQVCTPKIQINGNTTSPIKFDEFIIGFDFNTLQTNPNPLTKTLTISNAGDEPLEITAININNDQNPPDSSSAFATCGTDGTFTVIGASLPITLDPYNTATGQADSIDLTVQFAYAGAESSCVDCTTPFLGVHDASSAALGLPVTTMDIVSNDPTGTFTLYLGGSVSDFF